MKRHTIVRATSSPILTAGLNSILRSMTDMTVETKVSSADNLFSTVNHLSPAAIIADMADFNILGELKRCRDLTPTPAIIGLSHSVLPPETSRLADATLSVYDSADNLREILQRTISDASDTTPGDLTPREKEVIKGIVKGLSNKEIASEINVSVNTVMTHRRNIASKLRIHSPAGLTIFAIVSKLVSLDEIKDHIDSI